MSRWHVVAGLCLATFVMSCASSSGKIKNSHRSLGRSSSQVEVKEGAEMAVQLMTCEQVIALGTVVRPHGGSHFAPIRQEGYVNYAEKEAADLLTSYNLYQRYDHGLERDFFGHPPWLEGWRANPYLDDQGRSPLLLFKVTVRNLRREKIVIVPSEAVILDDQGNQRRALSLEDLLALSQTATSSAMARLERGMLAAWGRERQLYLERDVLRRTLLLDQRIFPSITCTGIVAFEKAVVAAKGFQLLFPEVVLYKDGRPFKTADFRFVFSGEGSP